MVMAGNDVGTAVLNGNRMLKARNDVGNHVGAAIFNGNGILTACTRSLVGETRRLTKK